jgi:hypothetical protein
MQNHPGGKDWRSTCIIPEPFNPMEWICRCGARLMAAWLPAKCSTCERVQLSIIPINSAIIADRKIRIDHLDLSDWKGSVLK